MSFAVFHGGCPGARSLKEPKPEYVRCPNCDFEVEMWTDEVMVRCPSCQEWVTRERGQSCIDWCPKAEECIGTERYQRLKRLRQENATE